MNRAAYICRPVSAIILGHNDAGTHRQPHEKINQQIDQRAGSAYGAQRSAAAKTPYHHHIRRVEQ